MYKAGFVIISYLIFLLPISIVEARALVVDGSQKNFSSIQSAVDAANIGDVVVVKPGKYEESVSLKEGVTLKGENVDECIIVGQRAPAVTMRRLRSAKVESLTLIVKHGWNVSAVAINNSQVIISKCIMKKSRGSGVAISGMRNAVSIKDCQMTSNNGWGIVLNGNSTGIISNNECKDNNCSGITIYGHCPKLKILNNKCIGNQFQGISLKEGASPLVKGNECSGNEANGISNPSRNATPRIVSNTCRKNRNKGILVSRGSLAEVIENICEENSTTGIAVYNSGTFAVLRGNASNKNKQSGIAVGQDARCHIFGNILESNGLDAIAIYGSETSAKAEDNICVGNRTGLRVYDNAKVFARMNIMVRNQRGFCGGRIRNQPMGEIINLGFNCIWGSILSDYELCEPCETDISQDPLLDKDKEGKYVLLPNSPCIGSGLEGKNIGELSVAEGEDEPND